jgi:platelet-activating factor acetylhydrolase
MEIEVPVKQPQTFYTHEKTGISLRFETVLMAIYYPAALGTGHGRAPDGSKTWSRQLWLPKPRAQIAKGYGKFAGIGVGRPKSWFINAHTLGCRNPAVSPDHVVHEATGLS